MSSFCYAPWANINISPNGLITPCCKFNYNSTHLYNINHNTIDEYLNSDILLKIKNQFNNNIKPQECVRCWDEEENNVKSKRILDFERWCEFYNTYDFNNFITASISLNNVCNLKCRICNSNFSSKWKKEEIFYTGSAAKLHKLFTNNFVVTQIVPILKNIIHIDIPGGEPFLTDAEEHLEFLNHIISTNTSHNISLHYTTNATIFPKNIWWEKWKYFKNIDIQLSIDGLYKHFEYNRFPAIWNTCFNNIKKYQEATVINKNIQLSIAHTLSIFTIFYLPEFVNWCDTEGLPKPWIGRLKYPKYYQSGIVPFKTKQIIKNKFISHKSPIVSAWADEVFINDASEYMTEFKEWTLKIDSYRNQSFNKTFPELSNLL